MDIVRKRLKRKRAQLKEVEDVMTQGEVTSSEKRKFIELKAIVNELENCIDIAESMCKMEK